MASRIILNRALLEDNPSLVAESLVDRMFLMVRDAVAAGNLKPGTRLPSIRRLAEDCIVSRDTASKALDKLVAHGIAEARRGSGFYVKGTSAVYRSPEKADRYEGVGGSCPVDLLWYQRLTRPSLRLDKAPGTGQLPTSWLNEEAFTSALRGVARENPRATISYGDPKGYLPLRQQLQLILSGRGIHAEPNQILLTGGATEALHLVVLAFLRTPGDAVLVEDPGPMFLVQRLLASGLNPVGVPRLEDGPDIDALRLICKQHRPKAFFLSSTLHNPTSKCLAAHKAFQILQLADEFDLILIEDDSYADLITSVHTSNLTKLATLDQLRRVIYIGSFSKTMGAGLRVGYLAASLKKIEWLEIYSEVTRICGSSLMQRVVHRILTSGNYRHSCEQIRTRLDFNRAKLLAELARYGMFSDGTPPCEFGMYLWISLGDGVNTEVLARDLYLRGHLTAPGAAFSCSEKFASYMRFNIATSLGSPTLGALLNELTQAS